MEARRTEGIGTEHNELLRKQLKVLESGRLGTASDSKLLEYEVRQEIVEQLCTAYLVGKENDRCTHKCSVRETRKSSRSIRR